MIIALDTNFLIYCAKQKIDFLSEISRLDSGKNSIIVPSLVYHEIEMLSKGKTMDKKHALSAKRILESCLKKGEIAVENILSDNADNALLEMDKPGNAIATLDAGLRRRIKHARVIVVRQLSHLAFE